MPLSDGVTFAGYTILRLLGSGGMGEVYLAQHPRLPRHDALKVLPLDVSADARFRDRFAQEADLAAKLWHPHIVGVHDRGEFDGQIWISMDFVDGTDASRLLADRYPAGMPQRDVVEIVTAVAGALDYAHKRGLLHRDVKPANIMLTHLDDEGDQRILLTDFGIARTIDDISGLTTTNMTVGTVAYSAPEQLIGEQLDGRGDEYALAATAYHLLTGSQLFPHSNPAVVISRHLNTAPPALAHTRPELAALDPVLAAALAKDPDDRFPRCLDFARALAAAANPGDQAAAAPTLRAPAASRPSASTLPPAQADTDKKKGRKRHRILLGAALAAVLVAAVGVIGYMNRPKHNTASTPSPPVAVLAGTYRLVYDSTKQTDDGASDPHPNTDSTRWRAFRSLCTSTGCVATGTALDTKNPQVVRTPALPSVLHFADGHWQETPFRIQSNQVPQCLGVDGKVVEGTDTEMTALSLEPQPDGTLRGVLTNTVITNECGHQGEVAQIPVVATRTGDVPAGVTVADPAGVTATSSTNAPAPPAGGPVLVGSYRFDFDAAHVTLNGEHFTVDVKKNSERWAFRSSCTSTRCVATGMMPPDNNQPGPPIVLQFTDGGWQGTPRLQAPAPCGDTGSGSEMLTKSWSLQPQPDGTLRGTETSTVLTNECGSQGNVVKIPFVVTRIGDAPTSVVLADPALFEF